MKRSGPLSLIILVLLISCSLQTNPAADSRVKWIGTEELRSVLDEKGLIIFAARYSKDWQQSDRKIRGAVRLDASEVDQLEGFYLPEQKIVIYCA